MVHPTFQGVSIKEETRALSCGDHSRITSYGPEGEFQPEPMDILERKMIKMEMISPSKSFVPDFFASRQEANL